LEETPYIRQLNSAVIMMSRLLLITLMILVSSSIYAQQPRAREIGIPFNGIPGSLNSITDVTGVEVGHSTIISGRGVNEIGKGPVRTGVTAIFPRGKKFGPVYANWYSLNGNGEMTGTTWVTESGFLETPIMITNTNSVGVVRDAVLKWFVDVNWYSDDDWWYIYPVVAETYDGFLNDIYGFHVKEEHVWAAIADANPGKVEEGNVGGGTGMMCLGFKGGIGSSSRLLKVNGEQYTLGVLVQSNFGAKKNLTIAGVPVGVELMDTLNSVYNAAPDSRRQEGDGSIIVVVATDAPLLPHQLKRIAQRIPIGIGNTGGRGSNGSGDIFMAFSTANEEAFSRTEVTLVETLSNGLITPFFEATVQATEEAIINAMVAAETMEGINGNKAYALPHELVVEVLKKYNRLKE
jgi:D-aminopeptidase